MGFYESTIAGASLSTGLLYLLTDSQDLAGALLRLEPVETSRDGTVKVSG